MELTLCREAFSQGRKNGGSLEGTQPSPEAESFHIYDRLPTTILNKFFVWRNFNTTQNCVISDNTFKISSTDIEL